MALSYKQSLTKKKNVNDQKTSYLHLMLYNTLKM